MMEITIPRVFFDRLYGSEESSCDKIDNRRESTYGDNRSQGYYKMTPPEQNQLQKVDNENTFTTASYMPGFLSFSK